MKSIKVCEYSRSRSFHGDLILQDQASGERSQDQWSSGFLFVVQNIDCWYSLGQLNNREDGNWLNRHHVVHYENSSKQYTEIFGLLNLKTFSGKLLIFSFFTQSTDCGHT